MMTRRTMLALAAGAFAADRKNRAPVSHDMVAVQLPEATPTKLSNGLTLLTMEDHRFPLAWVRFRVDGAGMVYSPAPGVAQVTAEMLDQGSKQRSARQISEEAGRLGAKVQSSGYINRELAVVDGSGLSSRFDDWLAICADCVVNPAYSSDEFNSLKQRWQVNRHLKMAEAPAIAEDTIIQLIYGTHPAGEGDPTPAEIAALTPEIAADWHRQRYAPGNTLVSVIGRVHASEVAARAEKLLGDWKARDLKFSLPPEPQPAAQRHIAIVGRSGAPQTRLELGDLLIQRSDPAYFAMVVLDHVLGQGGDSRLQRVLESSGQAQTASSSANTAHYAGYWQISAAVRTELTGRALRTILGELRRLCDEPVPPQELDEAKSAVMGRFALTLEHPTSIINYSYQRHRYGFSTDYWERYPARISAVTAAEVQAVAQKYYDPDRAHIVAVGDESKIHADLAKLGPIDA
jgi:zinc protease